MENIRNMQIFKGENKDIETNEKMTKLPISYQKLTQLQKYKTVMKAKDIVGKLLDENYKTGDRG